MEKYNYNFLKKKISSGKFSLQNLEKKDIEIIRNWRNQQVKVLRQNKYITKNDQKKYFKNYILKQVKEKKPETFLFAFKENNITIGYGGLVYISWDNRRAEVSYLLNTKLTKKKKNYEFYTKKYFSIIKILSFKKLKLNKIFTETFYDRKFHIKILEKFGFKFEGKLLKHNYKKGKFIDVLVHGMVKNV